MSKNKMPQKDIKKFKNKCKLWCKLNGVKFGSRYISKPGIPVELVYEKACNACRVKNNHMCIGHNKKVKNKPLLVLDTVSMRLYINVPFKKIHKSSLKNMNFWCVEWVNHV